MGAITTAVLVIVTVIAIIIILITVTITITTTTTIIKRCTKADVEVGAVWILERRMTHLYIHQERIQWGHSNISEFVGNFNECLLLGFFMLMQMKQATNMNLVKLLSITINLVVHLLLGFHVLTINYKYR